jgi:hypothetical protein
MTISVGAILFEGVFFASTTDESGRSCDGTPQPLPGHDTPAPSPVGTTRKLQRVPPFVAAVGCLIRALGAHGAEMPKVESSVRREPAFGSPGLEHVAPH